MFKTNEYFDGKVKSLSFSTLDGPATIGVMAAGTYEFGTSTVEHMTIISGKLVVQLPDDDKWHEYLPFETFIVSENRKFKVKTETDTAYLCLYK
jgi:purine/pyrimidine-nucleoside phosphorylase